MFDIAIVWVPDPMCILRYTCLLFAIFLILSYFRFDTHSRNLVNSCTFDESLDKIDTGFCPNRYMYARRRISYIPEPDGFEVSYYST